MKHIGLGLAFALLFCSALKAEPEIKGTAEELTDHLRNAPRFAYLSGESEVSAPATRQGDRRLYRFSEVEIVCGDEL